MFYSYDLSFDRASSLVHGLALTATNIEASAAGTRKNGSPLILATTESQFICGATNPFSSDFSSDFGGGAGYVVFTVNKFLRSSGTQTAFLTEPPTKFNIFTKAALTTSSEVAHIAVLHLAAALLRVLSSEATGLVLARPWHVIVAAKDPSAVRVVKAISKVAFHALDSEASSIGRALGHTLGAVSTQALQTLFKVVDMQHTASSQGAQILFKVASKIQSVASGEAVSSTRSFGKLLVWVIAEIPSVARGLPWHINAVSGEAPRLSFGGGNLFARAFGVLFGEGVAMLRGQAMLRGLSDPNVAGLTRAPGRVSTVADAEAAGLLKQTDVLRGTLDGQAMASRRQPGVVRGVLAPSFQAMQAAGAHFAGALATTGAQIAGLFTQHIIGRSLSILRTQSSSVSLSSVRTLLRSISVASSQSGRIVRGISTSVAALSGAAQALARAPGRLLGVAASSVAFLITVGLHFFLAKVVSPEVVSQRASFSATKGTTSPEEAAVARLRGKFLSAVGASVANLLRGLAAHIAAIGAQAISLTNAIRKIAFNIIWPEVLSALKGVSKAPATASPEATASVTRKGSNLGTAINAQVSALRRMTSKFLLAFISQALGIGGRGGSKVLRTTSSNIAAMFRSRGVVISTSQGQSVANVVYYHFFVAPWAYQQTSLLPPFGGPAEPPSFGPIDPADQTIFGFDWTSRAYPNDTIMSALVTCVPPFLPFLAGSLFINGNLVEVTVPPFPEPILPTIYSLRCTATFSSGRVSSFSIPVPVRTL